MKVGSRVDTPARKEKSKASDDEVEINSDMFSLLNVAVIHLVAKEPFN